MKHYDVIIVGGGLAGLSSASYLSQKGVKVALFEKLNQLGGYVHSFKRGPYIFEASTHQIIGIKSYNIFKKLGLKNIIPIESKELVEFILFNDDILKKRYLLPKGAKEIKDQLIKWFPQEKNSIHKYFKFAEAVYKELLTLSFIQMGSKKYIFDAIMALMLNKGKGIIKKIGALRYNHLIKSINLRYSEFLNFIKNKELFFLLSVFSLYMATPVSEINAALLMLTTYSLYKDAPFLIKNSTNELINELENTIINNGGEIYKSKEVVQIDIENNQVKNIITKVGDMYTSKAIISAINTQDVFLKMIDKDKLPSDYVNDIKTLEYTCSATQLFIGLPLNIKEYGITSSTTIFCNGLDDEKMYNHTIGCSSNEKYTSFILTNYSAIDLNMAPEGYTSMVIVEFDHIKYWEHLSDLEYKRKKKEITDKILNKVQKLTGIPFKEKAEVVICATPKTFKHYSSAPYGCILGPASKVKQSLIHKTPAVTPLKNLFLSGSFTYSPSVVCSLQSGIVTSNIMLKSVKL